MTTPVETQEETALTDVENAVFEIVSVEEETPETDSSVEMSVEADVDFGEVVHTGAMIALIPTQGNIDRLAVENGEHPDELHCTVLYLGEAADLPDEAFEAVMDSIVAVAEANAFEEQRGPVVADGFNVSLFNPHHEEKETCVVLGLSGSHLASLGHRLREGVLETLESLGVSIPEQHEPWIPHVTLAYTDDHGKVPEYADRTGEVTFDRIRLALGNDVYDVDLSPETGMEDGPLEMPEESEEEFSAENVSALDDAQTFEVSSDTESGEIAPDEITEEPVENVSTDPGAWRGILVVEGVESGDGRMFAEGSLKTAPLPLPLMWQRETDEGHKKSVQAGRIDDLWREGNQIWGSGVFDLQGDDGIEAHRQVSQKFLRGVSVDVDSVKNSDVEMIFPKTGEEASDDIEKLFSEPDVTVFHKGRLRGATLVQFPAFVEASIALSNADVSAEAETEEITASTVSVDVPVHAELNGEKLPVGTITVEVPVSGETEAPETTLHHEAKEANTEGLVACACEDDAPPREFFENPGFTELTAPTLTADGRYFGHAAPWGACHTGFSGVCRTAPREASHDYFLLGETLCADGSTIATGTVTLGTGHASTDGSVTPFEAIRHYDHTGTAIADIVTGEDEFGIWFSGAVRPGVSPLKLRSLRSAKLSGDWRKFGNKLRLVALLAVNVPGFPVPRTRAALHDGRQMALVAASINPLTPRQVEMARTQEAFRSVLGSLAKRVGRDPESRMEELNQRIHGR